MTDQTPVFTQTLVTTGATDIDPDPGCCRAMDPDKALCRSSGLDVTVALYGSTGHRDKHGYVGGTAPREPHGHGWQIRHWASPWPLVTWATGDYTASGYGRTMDPDMAPAAALAHIPPWTCLAGMPPTSAYW